jgi:hypothetical protein
VVSIEMTRASSSANRRRVVDGAHTVLADSYCPPTATAPASAVQTPPAIVQPPAPVVQIPMPSSAYFANCSAARGAGSAPLYAGQPGYRSALDRDGDGVACE